MSQWSTSSQKQRPGTVPGARCCDHTLQDAVLKLQQLLVYLTILSRPPSRWTAGNYSG